MAMTEAERRAAKKEAYKRWYMKKHGLAAKNGVKAKTETPKKIRLGKAQKKPGPDKVKAGIVKSLDKLVGRGKKTVSQAAELVKAAASLVNEAYKTKDAALYDKVLTTVCRKLSMSTAPVLDKTRLVVSVGAQIKTLVPKGEAEPLETDVPDSPADETQENPEVPVGDMNEVEDAGNGDLPVPAPDNEDEESDDESEDEDSDEEDDEDRDIDIDDDYLRGRGEMMTELDEQETDWGEQ